MRRSCRSRSSPRSRAPRPASGSCGSSLCRAGRKPMRSRQDVDPGGSGRSSRLSSGVLVLNRVTMRQPAASSLAHQAIVVVAEVEDIGRARFDRHLLGGGDVVDVGGGHRVIDRAAEVRIVDDMRLGAEDVGREARPFALRRRANRRPVESISRTASPILRRKPRAAPASMRSNRPEKTGQSRTAIGVGEGRALRRLGAEMIEPRPDGSPSPPRSRAATSAAQLGEQQRISCWREVKRRVPSSLPCSATSRRRPSMGRV